MFKTFVPFFIDDTHIKIFNIYDSRCPLIDSTDVADIEVGGIVFANATDLINAIHGVLFSRTVAGDIDNAQIELNRLAIISLQNSKSDVGHVHDDRYYTKSQIDQLVTSIVDSSDLIASGQIDGDNLIFFNNAGLQLFSLDAKRFTSQGTIVSFANGVLTLKNERGEVLSQTSISAEESYYDKFQFLSGLEDDLGDLIPTEKFSVVETTSGLFFFVSKIGNKEVFEGKRLLVNLNKFRVDFGQPDITNGLFKAWGLAGFEGAFVSNEFYTFDFWELESPSDNIPVTFTTTATDVPTLVAWLNTQNPPIEITANQIPEWELTDGTRYRFENKGKGVYGVGQTPIVEGDFKLVLDGANTKKLETITTPGIYPLWNVVLENVQRIVNGQESGFVTSVNEVLSLSGVSVVKKDMPIVYGFDLINGAGTIVSSVAELNAFPHSDGATVVLSFGGSSYLYVSVSAQWILIGIFTAISNTFAEIELEAEYATVPKVTSSDYGMMVVNLDKVISTTNGELSDADNVQIDLMRSFINFPTSVIAVKNKVVLTDDLVFSKKKMNDLFVKVVANDVNHFDFNFDYRYKNISGTVILKERRTLMLNELALLKANQTGGLVLTAILGNLEGTIEGVTGEGDKFKEPLQTAFDNTTNENMVVNAILQRDDISQVTVTVIANDLTDRTSFATVTGEKVIISDIEAIHTGKLHQWFNFGHEFVMPFESEFVDTFTDIGTELQGNNISSYTKKNGGHMSLSAIVGKEIQLTEDVDADVIHVTGHGANDPIRIDWTDGDKTFRPNLIIVGAGLETDLDANWQTSFGFGMEFIEPTSVSTVPTIPLGASEPDVHQQSPATAIVAGKLRAIKKSVPNATWQEVRLAARATASRATAWDMYRGFGVIDTAAAIAQLKLDVERNSLVKANIYNRNNKVAKSIDYSKINEDVAVPKRHLASLGLVVADEIVNKAVSFMKDDGGFRDLKADIPGFYKTKFLKQSIKRLHENEEFDGLTGIFLPEASRTSNGTSGKLYNLLNPAISFGFTRNSLKYGHRESLKIVEFTAHEPAICYLNGYPELIVEPQRTNLVLNSEPTANEGAASAGVTYQTLPNPFGFASWVNVPFSSSVFGFRYNGNVTDANFYEQHYYIKVPKGMAIDFSNDASVLDSYLSVVLRGNININKTAKFKLKKITNELYFLAAIDFPRGSTNNANNGIALPNTTAHQRDAIYTGIGLIQTTDTAFVGSYIRTTGATKTVNADVYTISNLLANGMITATEGTIIERGSNQEVRTVWIGGNKLKFIDNALVSTVAEVPNNNAFTLDTSSYRLSEILIYNKAILP
jgi:hypothetical protein